MEIKVISKIIVEGKTFSVGDYVEVETKWDIIEGKIVCIFHDKILVTPIGNIPYDIYLENIVGIK